MARGSENYFFFKLLFKTLIHNKTKNKPVWAWAWAGLPHSLGHPIVDCQIDIVCLEIYLKADFRAQELGSTRRAPNF